MTNLVVFSHAFDLVNEAELVNGLFKEGLKLFHLKKPLWDVDSQRHFFEQIDPEFHSCISVHQHRETISEFGLKYFHIRGVERTKTELQKQEGLKYSTSFHSYEELKSDIKNWDYCFLGPVFESISKTGYKSSFSKDLMIDEPGKKIFALGGISKHNIESVFERGFYGAAVLGSVWNDPENAVKNYKELKSLCRQSVHSF